MKGPEGYLYLVLTLRWLFPPMRSLSPCCRTSPCVLVAPMAGAHEDKEPVLPVLPDLGCPMGSGWITADVTGLKARKGKSIKFLWAVDFPSRFEAHFREMLAVEQQAFHLEAPQILPS